MRHHYVPEFLLRAWGETTCDKKVEAFRLNLPNAPSKRWSPKATGYEHNLYALTEPSVAGVSQQDVETEFLQRVDSDAAVILEEINTSGLSSLTQRDCYVWVYFLLSLRARTPEAVHLINTVGPQHLKTSLNESPEEYDARSESFDPPTLEHWTERYFPGLIENFGIVTLDKLVLNPRVAKILMGMTWWLWNFEGQKNHLLLSDRPCIFTAQFDKPNLAIALPIGPSKAFMMTKSERVANSIRSMRHQDLLMRINESSLNQAHNRVYALDRSPHRFICNRLAEQSSGLDPNDIH